MYQSEDRIWDMEVFPIRLGVEAEIFIPPEHDIPNQTRDAPLHLDCWRQRVALSTPGKGGGEGRRS